VASKLNLLALVVALAASRLASAETAADLTKRGIEHYKAGRFKEAATDLGSAYALEPKLDTLFALAQAERLAGDCTSARPHYQELLDKVSDLNVAKLVEQNLALCPEPAAVVEPVRPVEPPPPQIVTKTVVREVSRTDKLAASLAVGGGLLLGVSGGLYLAASGNRDAADRARSLEDHDVLADRANTQRTAMVITAGAGAVMVGVAVVRWMTGRESAATSVAITPAPNGGALWVTSRW